MHEWDEKTLAAIAREAAERAGVLIREAFGTSFRVESKSTPLDYVTEIDQAAERLIEDHLLAAVPGSAILGEEYGARDGEPGGIRWHVDPIDGTNNFVVGQPYFAVSIGIERDGRLIGGAVHDPIHRETFWATSTEAWANDDRLPSVSENPGHAGMMTSQPFQGLHIAPEDLADYIRLLCEFGVVRNPGSLALQITHVAIGRASAALEVTGGAAWDIAGGFAIAQATGCTIVPLADATPGYGQWGAHSYLITRDPEVAARVVPQVRGYIERGTIPPRFAEFIARS